MGLLIFAFRKLFLKRRINQLNGRQMQLQQIKLNISDQISRAQQAKAATLSSFQNMMSNSAMQNTSIFQMEMNGYNSQLGVERDSYQKAVETAGGDMNSAAVQAAKSQMEKIRDLATAASQSLFMNYNMAQQQLTMKANAMSQAISASDEAELKQMQRKDTQIDLEIASNDTQLKQLEGQYDKVEKAEDDAAKKSAGNFGIT